MKYSLFHNIDKYADDGGPVNVWGEYRPGHRLTPYYAGDVDVYGPAEHPDFLAAAEELFARHNRDNRPCGRLAPSLSIGDVIVFHNGKRYAFACAMEGFVEVDVDTLVAQPVEYLEWLENERRAALREQG